MDFLGLLAFITGIAMGLANFPQAYRIVSRKSAHDISILTYSILFLGATVWTLYGFQINDFAVIIANLIGVAAVGTVILSWLAYR